MSKFSNALKTLRKSRDFTQKQLADLIGVSESAIGMYERGMREPNFETLETIADVFNVNMSDLINSEQNKEQSSAERVVASLPMFNESVAAGHGWLLEGYEYEYYEFEDAPKSADFALRVRGNSMSPMYDDGDIVFVRQTVLVESGQVGVFCLNGEGYMKQLQGNRLISLNTEFDAIVVCEHDSFYTAGRVVGKVT